MSSDQTASSNSSRCPVDHSTKKTATGECPVDHKSTSLWKVLGIKSAPEPKECSSDSLPASLEEAAKYAQTPRPGQRLPLSTHRAVSTIPRGSPAAGENADSPHHQPKGEDSEQKWVYPSEQQVFNAMKRKGWEGVEEESIPSFLQIHNTVNEKSWKELQKWESSDITLVKFQGRPSTLTPKAWFLSTFLFQEKPFDRHDWIIDNGVDHEKRYVLDFYMTESKITGLPRVDVDVRPALDSPTAVVERAQRLASDMFPGIATALRQLQSSNSDQS